MTHDPPASPARRRLAGRAGARRVLITAGPTREYIDPVRYISNDSSGRMGFALARAARARGFGVTLIAGPVALETPEGVARIGVTSAGEMRTAVMKCRSRADIIIMAAAVADFAPAKISMQKIKKTHNMKSMSLKLSRTPDILAELGHKKRPGQTIVGFALETESIEKNARKKLIEKNCDWIVANSHRSIGGKMSRAILIHRSKGTIRLPMQDKRDLAKIIISCVAA